MRSTIAFAACLLIFGCVEKSRDLTSAEEEQLRPFVSNRAPSPQHPLDVSFENKIRLLGYDVNKETWRPGEELTVTWYWKADRALEAGWKLFTHVADGAGTNQINADGQGVVRRFYPPGRWKSGEYIKDVQTVALPANWSSARATFYLGVWNGPHRLQVTRGPKDTDNRALGLTIPTGGTPVAGAPRPRVFELRVQQAEGPIRIDGKLDEPAWANAARTAPFVNTMTGAPAEPRATAKLLWNDENLYVAFEVADNFLTSNYRNRDDELWNKDVVEIMVDPDGDARNYFEMQVSPAGVIFDTRYDGPRRPAAPGHKDWDSRMQAKVTTDGRVNDEDEDRGYTVEIAIPWSAFAAGDPPARKPNPGETWRMNMFVMDSHEDGGQSAVGWSAPRVPDFHTLDRFGRVTFAPNGPMPVMPTPGETGMIRPGTPQMRLPPGMIKQLQRESAEPSGGVRMLPTKAPPGTPLPQGAQTPRTPPEARRPAPGTTPPPPTPAAP